MSIDDTSPEEVGRDEEEQVEGPRHRRRLRLLRSVVDHPQEGPELHFR